MKLIKRGIITIGLLFFLFFLLYKPTKINLDGKWKTNQVVLQGKKIYPDSLAKFVFASPNIIINGWSNSISIPLEKNKINARFEYIDKERKPYKIKLSSKEKSLNGDFDLVVDTINIGPQAYIVDVKIKSSTTLIHFQKNVVVPPWKPQFPKKGQV